MTDRELMQQALDALEKVITAFGPGLTLQQKAATALRQALVDADDTSQERVDETAKHQHVSDMVNHPPHYKSGGIETIDFIEAKELPYHLGNVVKYISRAGIKSHCPIEDLRKAQWYLNRYVQLMEKTN